jgi:uncharacterized coiled-coil DUF342 family protein
MCAQRRSERVRDRKAKKRAEALSRLPQMLAEEQALVDKLNDLHRKTKAMGEHAQHDKKIAVLLSDWEQIRVSLVSELSALVQQLGTIMVEGGVGGCGELRQRIEKIEQLKDRAGELGEKLVDLCDARADFGIVDVDRDEMAARIDAMAAFFDKLEAGVQKHRATVNSICPESSDANDHAS